MRSASKPTRSRIQRALVAVALAPACAALAPASISTAAAAPSAGASRVARSHAAQPAHHGGGRGAPTTAGAVTTSQPATASTGTAVESGASSSTLARPRNAERHGTRGRSRSTTRSGRASSGGAASGSGSSGSASTVASGTRRTASRGREGGRHREGKRLSSVRSQGRRQRKASVASSTPAASPVPALVATHTTAVSTPATIASATPVAGSPAPVSRAHAKHRVRAAGAARPRASTGGAPAATVPASAPAPAPARTEPAATRRAAPARKRAASSSFSSSPIVRTFTRIVNVVPVPIRFVMGILLLLVLAAAARSRVTALRARRLEAQRQELLDDVGLLQAALLPLPPARLGPVGTSAAYRPADGPGAGGDFYDVFALPDGQLAVIVGDVAGHGRDALPHTALVRFTLHAYLEAGLSPRDAVQTAGAVLARQLGGLLATVIAAKYDPRERLLVYASAGHPPPIVIGESTIAPITVASSPPLGAGLRTGSRQTVVSVPGPSRICFYTDGVTESRVGADLYGSARLTGALADLEPGETARDLLDRVATATDSRPDDMAACVLSIEDGEGEPSVLVEELELDREEAAHERVERFLIECGVEPQGAASLLRSARTAAGPVGTVLLEVRPTDGSPEVALRSDNVALLHTRQARRHAGIGGRR